VKNKNFTVSRILGAISYCESDMLQRFAMITLTAPAFEDKVWSKNRLTVTSHQEPSNITICFTVNDVGRVFWLLWRISI